MRPPLLVALVLALGLLATTGVAQDGGVVQEPDERAPAGHMLLDLLVVDDDGRPVPGAEIEVTVGESHTAFASWRRQDLELHAATSDADGRARLLFEGALCHVYAEKEGVGACGEFSVEAETTRPIPLRLELDPWATVEGRVVEADGSPVPDARVSVRGVLGKRGAPRPVEPPVTDEDGRFRVRVGAPGLYTLVPMHERTLGAEVQLHVDAGAVHEVTLPMPGAFRIVGTVVTADGLPVADAHVSARTTARSARSSWSARSGADGGFELLLAAPGVYELVAGSGDALVQDAPATVELADADPSARVELVVREAASIEGIVVDAAGDPAPEQLVRATPLVADGDTPLPDVFAAALGDVDLTDADGRFVLAGLHPDLRYELSGGIPAGSLEPVEARPGDTVALVVDPGPRRVPLVLAGRVVDAATGEAVTRFELMYGPWMRGVDQGTRVEVADPDGRFRIEGVQEWHRGIAVEAVGYPRVTVGPVAPGTPEAAALRVELAHPGAVVVRVVDEQERPVEGAVVFTAPAVSADTPVDFGGGKKTTADAVGVATFEDVPPGRTMLQAGRGALLSDVAFVDVPGAARVEVTLVVRAAAPTGALEVACLRDGEPREGAVVSVRNMLADLFGDAEAPGRQEAEAAVDDAGRVRFDDLRPGHYWVWPQVEGDFLGPRWVAVSSRRTVSIVFEGPGPF